MELDVTRMRILAAVARHGTMAGAASELNYTPSAVSQQVRRLESDVRAPVLERHPRGVTLTEVGRAVVARAAAIETQLRALQNDVMDLAGARRGSLRLGVFPTFAASILPAAVLAFRAEHPGVELSIHSSRIAPLETQLVDREIDLAVTWGYPWNSRCGDGVVSEDLMIDRTVLLLPADHRLAGEATVALEDVREEWWIVRADSHPTRELLSRSASAHGFEPRVAFSAHDYPEVQAMVAAGFGISLCPGLATQPLRDDIVVRSLGATVASRHLATSHAAGRLPTAAHRAMVATLRSIVPPPAVPSGGRAPDQPRSA